MKTNTINHQKSSTFNPISMFLTSFFLKIISFVLPKNRFVTYLKDQKHLKTAKFTLKCPIFAPSKLKKALSNQTKPIINHIWQTLSQTATLPQG